jgi:hypothetical protein
MSALLLSWCPAAMRSARRVLVHSIAQQAPAAVDLGECAPYSSRHPLAFNTYVHV